MTASVDDGPLDADRALARRRSSTRPRRSRTSSSARTPPRPSRRRSSSSTPRAPDGASRANSCYAEERAQPSSAPSTSSRRRSSASASPSHKKRPDGRAADEIRPTSRSRSASRRARTAPRCSRAARRRRSASPRSARSKEEMRLDTLGLETQEVLLPPLQLPAVLGRGGRPHAAAPKRRDIGHGALAERALRADGARRRGLPLHRSAWCPRSSSPTAPPRWHRSAARSLSLMDAGVPIKRPVAGIAMGLIKEGDDYVVLTDIAGVEDHLGDMDFKVAGTEQRHHRAADGHQDLAASPSRSCATRWRRPSAAACSSSARWPP